VLIFTRFLSPTTLDEVAGCGHGCATDLRLQAETLVRGKRTSRVVDSQNEFIRLLKHPQLAMIPAHEMLLSKARARDDVESGPKP
jgi:hypothetical protein